MLISDYMFIQFIYLISYMYNGFWYWQFADTFFKNLYMYEQSVLDSFCHQIEEYRVPWKMLCMIFVKMLNYTALRKLPMEDFFQNIELSIPLCFRVIC